VRRLTAKPECVRAVAFLPDGRLLSASGKKQVTVWNPADGSVTETIRTRMFVFALAVRPDGRELAIAGRMPPDQDESQIRIHPLYDMTDGTIYHWPFVRTSQWDRRSRSIWSMAYTSDGEYLIAARRMMGGANMYDGGDCHWWQRPAPFEHGNLDPAPPAYAVAANTSGSRFAVTGYSQLFVYDHPKRPGMLFRFPNHWASAVCFLPDGEVMIGSGQFLFFTDRSSYGSKLRQRKTGVRMIRTLAVSPTGQVLAVGGSPGRVEVYDLPTREKRTAYDFDLGPVQSLAFAPDGLTLAVGAEKGLIVVDVE
jgi:WD40 repeat protein